MAPDDRRLSSAFRIVDVRGDGNCFYYALFGAARHEGLLSIVYYALTKERDGVPSKETCFSSRVRRGIAESISRDRCPPMRAIANQLRSMRAQSLDLSVEFGEDVDRLLRRHPDDPREFANGVARLIATNGHYATQIDFAIVKHMLSGVGIALRTPISQDSNGRLSSTPKPSGRMQLVLNDGHYKYVAFPQKNA